MTQSRSLGCFGGYTYITQTGNPITAGIKLDGFRAGFSMHGIIVESRRVSLYYALGYTYQNVDNTDNAQTVEIDWSPSQAQLGAIAALTQKFRLYGGGSYGRIDGEECDRGTINRTTTISRDTRGGGFLGLDLNTDPDGYVGIEISSELTRGGEIYFKRRY